MASVRVKICALRMFSPAALSEPAIFPNRPARSQVQILAAVIGPRSGSPFSQAVTGSEGAVVLLDEPVHEPVGEFEVVNDFPGGVNFEVARRQAGKMRLQFVLASNRLGGEVPTSCRSSSRCFFRARTNS